MQSNEFDEDFYIQSDYNLVSIILSNIFSNALKYSEDCSNVTVKLYNEGNIVTCSITDEGIGISEEDKKRAVTIAEKKVEGTEVTIIDGGKEFHFIMEADYDNILDGAIAAGADLPFACKGGVCGTCRCKIVEGTAEMKINYALDESEVEKQLTLSCQAVPTSKKLVVDFGV